MEVSKEEFARLMKKAASINEIIAKALIEEFKIDKGTLDRWGEGESMPPAEMREDILKRTVGIMLQTLRLLADHMEEEPK